MLRAQLAVYFHKLAAPLFRAAASIGILDSRSDENVTGLVNLGGWVTSSDCPQLQAAWGSLLNVGPIVGVGAIQQGHESHHPLLMRNEVTCRVEPAAAAVTARHAAVRGARCRHPSIGSLVARCC